jgi:alpha-2-macroglobulin-like protein
MKRIKHLSYILTVLLLSISGFRIAEDPAFVKRLKESLRQYNQNFPEEKVYVQFDKTFYKPGEDIWFNVFVLNANTNIPSNISDVVYVELIDPKGNVATKLDLPVIEGTANGDFALAGSVPGGLYQVRAYTNWMKNFGADNFFRKELTIQRIVTPRLLLKLDFEKESYGAGEQVSANLEIKNLKNEKVSGAAANFSVRINGKQIVTSQMQSDVNGKAVIHFSLPDSLQSTDGLLTVVVNTEDGEESISRSVPIVLNKISIQFLPEGGNWVQGASSTMAFKAVNEFGKGADVAGSILDENHKVVAHFESFHMGMGAFRLKPDSGEKYFARIDTPAGNASVIPLPDPITRGFTLNVKSSNDSTVSWAVYSSGPARAHLVGQSHGEIFYTEEVRLQPGENLIRHSTRNFPAGIAVFTLFDFGGVEQCERLIFLNSDRRLKIQLKPTKERYLPGELVKLEIKTLDHKNKPVPSKISLAVVDDQLITFADDKQDNILSSLLLSSEVKGEVQEPSFYFDYEEPKAAQALDYLLMTQGWRRFRWSDVHNNNRTITYSREKVRNLSGMLVNGQGTGFSGEVTLLELAGGRRIVKVQTTNEGHFVFKNIDPTVPLLLLSRMPGEIMLKKEIPFAISLNDLDSTFILSETDAVGIAPAATRKDESEILSADGLDMSLDGDVAQLSEIIVTGFGVQEKSLLTSSSVTREIDTGGFFGGTSVESALQGRVNGIFIQPQTGNPGSQANVTVRGFSSLAGGRNEPLYVINGHPIGTSLNQNFSNGSVLGPEEIQSIEVIHSPEATALFGNAAANGAILITTRSRIGYNHFYSKKRPARYSSLTITPRNFSARREFYVPTQKPAKNETRKDFRSTVYWSHTLATDANGNGSLQFYNNDAVSAFRITAEGFSTSGLLGRNEEVYYTQLPLSLDAKLPQYLGFEDVLKLPIRVRNETSAELTGELTVSLPHELEMTESSIRKIAVQPKTTETVWVTVRPKGIEGEFPISIKLVSGEYADEMKQMIRIRPIGFPARISFSGKQLERDVHFAIRDAERNSIRAEMNAFPDVLSDLFTGAESILREPHGCFEQVSSSTFPNILVLQFLNQSGMGDDASKKRALNFIRSGYSQLAAYEIKGGGFEWFGHPPSHEGLTAYGLMEFHEMSQVFDGVDDAMLERTRKWLLSRKNGQGGFRQNAGKYGFSGASEAVTNAYVTYALSETGTNDILPEYHHAYDEVLKSNDMYRMALVAGTAFNLGKMADYNKLVRIFTDKVSASGFSNLKAEHSIVLSYGNSLQTEVISLWAATLMKSPAVDLGLINKCIQQIVASRVNGQFGSTQGTTLALKALTEFARLVRSTRDNGEIQIFVGDTLAEKHTYQKEARNRITLTGFAKHLKSDGEQSLKIHFIGTKEPLPYSVDVQWYAKTPQSSERCKVALTTSLSSESVRLNETVRLKAVLRNKSAEGLPMTVAVIGIPAGLSPQSWQLKELQEKEIFDFYEIMGENLVIYYRELAPNGVSTINLDLKAEIPGTYVGAASSAYLYYTNEYRHWVQGSSIVVQ